MTCALIRGLWGNSLLARRHERPPQVFARVLESTQALALRGDRIDAFYCFGNDNEAWLKYHGFSNVRKLSSYAWANPRIREEFHHRWDGAWVYGMSYWWHKLRILEQALDEYDSVIYMDIDVHQVCEIPDWFWDEIESGADFKASLYLQRNWTWGAGWRNSEKWGYPHFLVSSEKQKAAQTVPGCGFIYCRNKDVIKEALKIQKKHHFWLDHQIFAFLLDQKYGGWIGEEKYLKLGYHTLGYYYGRQVFPPPDDEIIWRSGGKETWHVSSTTSLRQKSGILFDNQK